MSRINFIPIASAAFIVAVLAFAIAAQEWILVAGAGVSAILMLPIIGARLKGNGTGRPRPDPVTNALLLLSRAQRMVVVILALAGVTLFAVVSKGWIVLIGSGPGLAAMVLWLFAVVRREGWSGNGRFTG